VPAPESRLALANAGAIRDGKLLVIGFDADVARTFDDATFFHQSLRSARACEGVADVRFDAWLSTDDRYDTVVLHMPKETERLRMLLVMARALMADGGQLVLIGRNDTGIRSAGRHVADVVGEPEVLDYRFHSRAWRARATKPAVASSLDAWESVYEAAARDVVVTAHSFPGIFARGRLDDGTRRLLETIEVPSGGRALDVGCGSGIIGAWLGHQGVVCDSVDDDAVAVEAARRTNGGTARAWASDVYSDVPEQYDLVVSNPPFHAGVRTSPDAAVAMIEGAPDHLTPRGELWLVANRFIDYLGPLRRAFSRVEIASEDPRFRVFRATNGR
jgi:16S rRNA (guanine1207-N2)-methyltransferase